MYMNIDSYFDKIYIIISSSKPRLKIKIFPKRIARTAFCFLKRW